MKEIMKRSEIIATVTAQICNMLENSIVHNVCFDQGIISECFEGWCEDGDVFAEDIREEATKLMRKVAPIVDTLTVNLIED